MNEEDGLIKAKIARAKLILVPCTNPRCTARDCPNHGYVMLELDGEGEVMGEVRTRAEAWGYLQGFKKIPAVSPQPEFLSAVRQADWLSGPMPSALFTGAGARMGPGPGKLNVVPMDVQVVNTILRAHGATPQEDRARMDRLGKAFGG